MTLISQHDGVLHHGFDTRTGATPGRQGLNRLPIIGDWLARAHRDWAYRRSIYRSSRALGQLSDRTLLDMGLNRNTILSAAKEAADRKFGFVTPNEP